MLISPEYRGCFGSRPDVVSNDVCNIEPALVGIYDFPVGSDLQIVRDERGISIYDTPSGREIREDEFYVPPQFRRRPNER